MREPHNYNLQSATCETRKRRQKHKSALLTGKCRQHVSPFFLGYIIAIAMAIRFLVMVGIWAAVFMNSAEMSEQRMIYSELNPVKVPKRPPRKFSSTKTSVSTNEQEKPPRLLNLQSHSASQRRPGHGSDHVWEGKICEGHLTCYGVKCYYFIMDSKDWNSCKQTCQNYRLSFVTIEDKDELLRQTYSMSTQALPLKGARFSDHRRESLPFFESTVSLKQARSDHFLAPAAQCSGTVPTSLSCRTEERGRSGLHLAKDPKKQQGKRKGAKIPISLPEQQIAHVELNLSSVSAESLGRDSHRCHSREELIAGTPGLVCLKFTVMITITISFP
ncbi:NKG2-D type II integral membrane protein [Fukomys damarensis]|uniref:NKG2-D type II integral membrane protein n=1 Tax=Fukomys damarensis TaxID=885580 RepID=A0A091D1Z7_FUKDA|nr:NKG2-D type II integral membrane protein [Fukomys damarensis]